MKVFFLFAPFFYEMPLAIARELDNRCHGSSFSGLTTGSRQVLDRVAASTDPLVSPLHWLDDLERKWLSTPSDPERLAKYEEIFGSDVLRRLITADRQVGGSLLTDAHTIQTPLKKLCGDVEMVRRYVLGVLDFAFESFEQDRPDIVFCYTVAGAPAFAISIVCHHLKIPFARISATHVGTRHILDNSTELKLGPVHDVFFRAIEDPSLLGHVAGEARDYLKKFREKPAKYEASEKVHKRFLGSLTFSSIAKRAYGDFRSAASAAVRRPKQDLRKAEVWRRAMDRLTSSLRARKHINSGLFGAAGDLPKTPFVYFPLQLHPEASTMVLAPMHTNQFAIIEALVKSLPVNMTLIVKEHITMLGRRPKDFYQRVTSLPDVTLASPFENPFSLIKNAELTCTITGTPAWEAIQLGRPALIFGNPHFLALGQGAVHCPDLSKLPEALPRALETPPAQNERIVLYLAAVMDQSFELREELYKIGVTEELVNRNPDIISDMCDALLNRAENTAPLVEAH